MRVANSPSFLKLQKRLNRKVGDKEYSKWVVVLPTEEIDELGWFEGTELEVARGTDSITLRPKKGKSRSSK